MSCRRIFKQYILKLLILVLFCTPFLYCCNISRAANASLITSNNLVQNSDNETLNFSGKDFGLRGPFELNLRWSKLFGIYLIGKYTQLFDAKNGLSAELDAGVKQRRLSATWGCALNSHQLLKFTAENLSQKSDFDFSSGIVSKWIYQNAFGVGYAYFMDHNLLRDVNFNTYYSKAISKNLADKNYFSDGVLFNNHRRIAGGVDKSLSVGFDLAPLPTTLIGLQANYDNISYRMLNDLSAKKDDNGLGATISLDQLVNNHVKFKLLISHRKPYQDYQAQIDWLLYSVPGSNLQLGFTGDKIIGGLGTLNDNQLGINFIYTWGGNQNAKAFAYNMPRANVGIDNLRDWVASPAVRMEQVLALVDQTSVRLPSPCPLPVGRESNQQIIVIRPHEIKRINVGQCFADRAGDDDIAKIKYTVKSLPPHHNLRYKNGVLTINKSSFDLKDKNKTFVVDFIPANVNSISSNDVRSIVIKVKPKGSFVPYPNFRYLPGGDPGPITLYWTIGEKYTDVNPTAPQEQDKDYHQLIFNDYPDHVGNDLRFCLDDKDHLGVKFRQVDFPWSPEYPLAHYYHIYLYNDAPVSVPAGTYKIDFKADCKWGGWGNYGVLPITIIVGAKPAITIPTLTFSYKKPVNLDVTQYIKSTPGYDLTDVQSDLSKYGLSLNFDKASQKTTITGTPIRTTEHECTIPIMAINRFGQTNTNFKLDILSPPIKLKDIGKEEGQVDKYIASIPLEDYFEVPVGSSKINGWEIEAKSEDGTVDLKGLDKIKEYFGLTIDDNSLQGKLKDVKLHSPYTFYISAVNDQGSSIDKDGNPAKVIMLLTVSAN